MPAPRLKVGENGPGIGRSILPSHWDFDGFIQGALIYYEGGLIHGRSFVLLSNKQVSCHKQKNKRALINILSYKDNEGHPGEGAYTRGSGGLYSGGGRLVFGGLRYLIRIMQAYCS